MKTRLLKFILIFQGLYYSLTGLWAIVSLDSFSRITEHRGEPFEMHSIAGMALVIGLFFIWSAFKEELRRPVGFLALGLVLAISIPELVYLPKIGNPTLFWVDFAEETIVGLFLIFILFNKSRDKKQHIRE